MAACFANLGRDPRVILERAASLCRPSDKAADETGGGVVVISHPHGSVFCRRYTDEAPTSLPTRQELEDLLVGLPLNIDSFEDGTPYVWAPGERRGKYLVVLRMS